jgi:hypothetical protein
MLSEHFKIWNKSAMSQPANKNQIIAINTALSKKGLMDEKRNIISNATNGRTTSSRDLFFDEAHSLLQFLNTDTDTTQEKADKMVRKLFAMCYDLGWIKEKPVVGKGGKIEMKKDYSTLYEWVEKYGYLKKELRKYSYEELPKLLTQFQHGPYAYYLSNKSK